MSRAKAKYFLNQAGQFVIEDYNDAPPFSNFFPGIAGLWGVPMWVFYVNRGQAITSFGIESKDKAILEFHPANTAYQLTALKGFRTFIKIKSGAKTICYEPFQNSFQNSAFQTKSTMAISSHDLTLEEKNLTLGLTVRVNYFTLPEEPYAALIRKVTIINTSKKKYSLEIIDGLPAIIPFGLNEWLLKHMSRTAEAWHQVSHLDKKAPYYNLKVAISDKPHVTHITAGNFYFGFFNNGRKTELLQPIIEPALVFGSALDFVFAQNFFKESSFKISQRQMTKNITPSAMGYAKLNLAPKTEKDIVSVFGHAHGEKQLDEIVATFTAPDYVEKKAKRNRGIIDEIKNFAFTLSSSKEFNLYCEQTFLDNVLRGGLPISLQTSEGKATLSVYTRKHGDAERDYNHFVVTPSYLSQGNGNYRDVNQNRRNDAWFNSDVKDGNIVNFLNLIQPDGYNPLIIKGMTFSVNDQTKVDEILADCVDGKEKEQIGEILRKGFYAGKLLMAVTQKGVKLKNTPEEFLQRVLASCHAHESAEHGEGFWSDHWAYNLDLIESYLALNPEECRRLLFERKDFSFYHNLFHVRPRDERYILTPEGCRQHHSVVDGTGHLKGGRRDSKLRTQNGGGTVYYTTLLTKLLCLVANKAATFDPSGIGIEMEADRPNWYDALNGLPGLLGSSVSETFELKRLCVFLLDSLENLGLRDETLVKLFEELHTFIVNLQEVLASNAEGILYWTKSNNIKEYYRHRILSGIDGQEKELSIGLIKKFLQAVVEKTDKAAELSKGKNGLYVTYFTHEITEYEKVGKTNHDGFSFIRPLAFKKRALPLFLEGFVHALRVEKREEHARAIYESVKKSPLFDKALAMYRVNDDLSSEPEEIGRARVFPSGWLENQSIWLHMEYKLLLELLRCGLYEEFYENFESVLIPFLNPQQYGRSILENSSFIVSSAHEDVRLHGRGFVARLSGTTAEWVHMWLLMNVGGKPFVLDKEGKLSLKFAPILKGELFTKAETRVDYFSRDKKWQTLTLPKNTYAFKFLNTALIVYHNPKRRDTFGARGVSIEKIVLTYPDNRQVPISSGVIPSSHAQEVREGKIARIDAYLN